jgi:hypothetical protein
MPRISICHGAFNDNPLVSLPNNHVNRPRAAGKYGYVDVNGDVKIIQYGADAMGFQPQGDLPEGIIIPPPVSGNCTDCGDYDYESDRSTGEETSREQDKFQVWNTLSCRQHS